jgi:hypothetical protein
MTQNELPLTEAIQSLRAELTAVADAAGEGETFMFALGPIELTLEASVTKSADGRIGWSVIGVGGSRGASSLQTIKLQLIPSWRMQDGTYSTEFNISGVLDHEPSFGPATNDS